VIVVDTNVISELMHGGPHPAVLAWVAAQPRALIYTTFIIAATALAAGASIATRDTDGFTGCGLTVINPWVES
jgi:predicted nucleic acid-binding protein